MKPLLARNYDPTKLVFPLLGQPKIDGVRGLTIEPTGLLVGRSLKAHGNAATTRKFSNPIYSGLDGELTVGDVRSSLCCRTTSGSLNRSHQDPGAVWYVFDDIRESVRNLPYMQRLTALKLRASSLPDVIVMPTVMLNNIQELEAFDTANLEAGYEGSILRNPQGVYKEGRSSLDKAELLRVKHFIENEAVVIAFEEGEMNNNLATTNLLGRTERSSHAENMVPNGQVGTLICRDLETGDTIRVAAGCMTLAERKYYFTASESLIGKVIKYKHFPKGVKDKPRFPTFQSFRINSDMEWR